MAKIKIQDIPRDRQVTKGEMEAVLGGRALPMDLRSRMGVPGGLRGPTYAPVPEQPGVGCSDERRGTLFGKLVW